MLPNLFVGLLSGIGHEQIRVTHPGDYIQRVGFHTADEDRAGAIREIEPVGEYPLRLHYQQKVQRGGL